MWKPLKSSNANKLHWWKDHKSDLPNWSSACRSYNLLQLQQNEFFHSSQTVLVTDRVVVWKIILKHRSCFSITLNVTSVKIIKNEVGCRDDTVPKTVDTRRHCEEE